MAKLSVALATFNEEANIKRCLDSVKDIADEIVIVDGSSQDNTVKIAEELGARVLIKDNPPMFHINKQKAIDMCRNNWVLQLDADEVVSKKLREEILKVINLNTEEIEKYQNDIKKITLFRRHQEIINQRDGKVGSDSGEFAAFFLPRANYFLGRYLRYGGVYPDGVIRLIRKDKAFLPCKDVHEQFEVNGRVGWLEHDLLHYDSPTFSKYIKRNNRYTTFIATQYKDEKLPKNPIVFINYVIFKPIWWFLLTYIRHKGFMDSWQGFVFSFFSSLRFPISYIKYIR